VNDLMVLLRHANSLENSLLIEGLLSLIWLTHENSDLNKLMRLSMINAQCGNVDNAITIINKVIERDPTYVEAHTKRAIYLYTLKKFQDSAISAKKALGKL
jgi:tetratricopeptide (TPR) repeat protein